MSNPRSSVQPPESEPSLAVLRGNALEVLESAELVVADATGEFPDLGDIGDEDILVEAAPAFAPRAADLGDLADEDPLGDAGTLVFVREEKAPASAAPAQAKPSVSPARVVPPASETTPILELDPDDLEEEQRRIEATQPFNRAQTMATRPPNAAPTPTSASLAMRSSVRVPTHLPSVVINDAPPARPASIAPLAIDLAPARPTPDATLKLAPITTRTRVRRNNTPMIAAAVAGGLALCAAAVIAVVSYGASDDTTAKASAPVMIAAKPREAPNTSVRSAIIETPETTPQKAAPAPGERDEDGTPVFSTSSLPSAPADEAPAPAAHVVSHVAAASHAPARTSSAPARTTTSKTAAPAPEPAPAAAPRPAPAAKSTTGTIAVASTLMTVQVDGDYKRVQGGRVIVSCGKHHVNAGRGTQLVDVPCGGVVSAQ